MRTAEKLTKQRFVDHQERFDILHEVFETRYRGLQRCVGLHELIWCRRPNPDKQVPQALVAVRAHDDENDSKSQKVIPGPHMAQLIGC